MKTKSVPIGIVGIDNNSMKTYLAMMAKSGIRPRTIIYLKPQFQGLKFKLLKLIIGTKFARIVFTFVKYRRYKKLKVYSSHFLDDNEIRNVLFSPPNYKKYCDTYSEVESDNINDPRVVSEIINSREKVFIYGGGGIVRDELFNLGIKFIHTHPGYLPYVRGSHCTHWSLLVRGKFGCTTFYMNQGIDTGSVILAKEYDVSIFSMPAVDITLANELTFFYVDPLIRAKTLVDVLLKYDAYDCMDDTPQDISVGETYYTMHPKLQYKAMEKFQRLLDPNKSFVASSH